MKERQTVAQLNARFRDDGWRTAGLEKMCHGCGEERLVSMVTIFGKSTCYCHVCSTSWVPEDGETA